MKTDQSLKNDFVKIEGKSGSTGKVRKLPIEQSEFRNDIDLRNEFMNMYKAENNKIGKDGEDDSMKVLKNIFRKIRRQEPKDNNKQVFILKRL